MSFTGERKKLLFCPLQHIPYSYIHWKRTSFLLNINFCQLCEHIQEPASLIIYFFQPNFKFEALICILNLSIYLGGKKKTISGQAVSCWKQPRMITKERKKGRRGRGKKDTQSEPNFLPGEFLPVFPLVRIHFLHTHSVRSLARCLVVRPGFFGHKEIYTNRQTDEQTTK